MGIQIKGSNDTISAADGSIVLEGATLTFTNENITGISTMASAEVTSGDLSVGISTFFVDNSTGLIGIATAAPSAAFLEIASTQATDSIRFRRISADVNIASNWSLKPYGGNLYFREGGSSDKLFITADGDLGITSRGSVEGVSKLNVEIPARTTAFSASDGDTWHDVLIENGGDAASNSVGIAFQVTGESYHKNAGSGIACVKNGTDSDYGADLAFITRPQSSVAVERLRITSTGTVGINTSVTSTANSGFDDLVIRSSAGGNTGITFLSSTTAQGTLAFADGGSSTEPYRGFIQYSHNGDKLVLGAGGGDRVTVGQTGDVNITGITTAKTFVPTEGQLSNRNLVINGAMQVAQRGTSSTTSGTYTADRFIHLFGGTDESPTTEVRALTSSDTGPWAKGFRKALKVTNGNQTGGAGASDYIRLDHRFESQDIAQCSWDHTSSSSYATVSFWAKSSVAQTFYVRLKSQDGTTQGYVFAITFGATNTWTKFTHTIPGAAGVQFDNDNNEGFRISWVLFRGTDNTGTFTLNQWAAFNSANRMPDNTSTWYTTNDATFELTGVQFEAGSAATPFEHRSYVEELKACHRYFWRYKLDHAHGQYFSWNSYGTTDQRTQNIFFPTPMRAAPSLSNESTFTNYQCLGLGGAISAFYLSDSGSNAYTTSIRVTTADTITSGLSGLVRGNNTTAGYFDFSSEL